MHEGRLPQTAREMTVNRDYLFPHSGSRPWLERPPLPHWVLIAFTAIVGHHDRVLLVRWPSALCGTAIVLLTAWMAARGFGRAVGLLSGLILATSMEFWTYSTLAEDDIYLALLVAAAVALFVRAEWAAGRDAQERPETPFGRRSWPVLLFFLVTALTNLTKGPLFGMAIIGSAVGAFLVWSRDARRLRRYLWVWGFLILIPLSAFWPALALRQFPDIVESWKFDYVGRLSGAYADLLEPVWYYAPALVVALIPWSPEAIVGLAGTWRRAWRDGDDALRLIWCWAIVPLVLLSFSRGKHHHYLLPLLPAWGVISAFGLQIAWTRIGSRWPRLHGPTLMRSLVMLLVVAYCAVHPLAAWRRIGEFQDDDTRFIREADARVPADKPLFINADVGSLDFFRLQFYSRPSARLLHNLTFLRDERITDSDVYVITRAPDRRDLETLGAVTTEAQSARSHDDPPNGAFMLFHLQLDPNLVRCHAPSYVTTMQALQRRPGPFCGPRFADR
jgi:4-amino-4-deoxy-L-arabinose transferase-like glycosyltransferase